MSDATQKALGRRRKLWFDYETAADEMRAKREAAYFDVGVEHGIAAARVHALGGPRKVVRKLGDRIVRELLAKGVTREDAVGAAIVAAWGMLGSVQTRLATR
jgi:hypothetical protein